MFRDATDELRRLQRNFDAVSAWRRCEWQVNIDEQSLKALAASEESASRGQGQETALGALEPVVLWLADRQLDLSWPVAGVPETLHLDNAPEFDSQALVRGTQEYGIALEHRPPKQPHFGGHIERLIGTVMDAVHLLPGTTFSNII